MPDKRPTLKDIAERCGVSKGTVNRAIHDKPGINAQTKARILEVIADLGFQPNYHARSLATGKTETIGVLLPDVSNEFFAMVCTEIEKLCWTRNYVMNLAFSNDRPEREDAIIASFLDRNVDGMIVFPVSRGSAVLRNAAVRRPLVLLLNDLSLPNTSIVLVNDYNAMRDTVQHLVDLGHRRIAYIDGYLHYSASYNDSINRARSRAYRDALGDYGLAVDPQLTAEFQPSFYDTADYSLLRSFLAAEDPPTAIACFHDRIAIWVTRGLIEMGYSVPHDISVTGFDNIRELQYIRPKLTTSAVPTRRLAEEALSVLFSRFEAPESEARRVLIDAQLIPGDSCAPPPAVVVTH